MRKLLPVVLVLGGAVAGLLAWRSATESGRRYAELLDLIRAGWAPSGSGWNNRDRLRFWGHVDWFRDRDPRGLVRRLVGEIGEGDDSGEAVRLATVLIEYRHLRLVPVRTVEGKPLPPPNNEEWVGAPDAFRFHEVLLDDARAVDRLARHPTSLIRHLVIHLLWQRPDAPGPTWDAAARLAEEDPDIDLRVEVIRVMAEHSHRAPVEPVLVRLAEHPDPVVRLAALAALTEGGDAQRARELVLGVLQEADGEVRRRGAGRVIRVPESLAARSTLGLELMAQLLEGSSGVSAEGWELAERYGNVLERRAVGEYDEPLDE